MNARDLLRRYLEQRREVGESELVLDGMSVDEVMRVLGAAGEGGGVARPATSDAAAPNDHEAPADHPRLAASEGAGAAAAAPAHDPHAASAPPPAARPDVRHPEVTEPADWRAALLAAEGRDALPPPPPDSTTAAPPNEPDPSPARPPADVTGARDVLTGLGVPIGLVVGDGVGQLFGGALDHLDTLGAIAETVARCTRCPLYRTATNAVPGEGNPDADFVVVGEAPGADEDATGRPFVGASGQLLTKILAAINLRREDVFICNVVKHRPPGNRNPAPDEVEACGPYLVRQLELLRPKVILTLGNFAAQTLLATKLGITKLRGQVHLYNGIPLVPTYHPAALLRNQAWKRPTWEDVQLARRVLDRARDG